MKHFVTAFIVSASILTAIGSSYGQNAQNRLTGKSETITKSVILTPSQSVRQSSNFSRIGSPKEKSNYFGTQNVDSTVYLTYFDSVDQLFNWYFLPNHISYKSPSSGNDTLDEMIAYAERFDAPAKTGWYLDSVQILMAALTFDNTNADTNQIAVAVMHEINGPTNTNGFVGQFIDFSKAAIDRNTIWPADEATSTNIVLPADSLGHVLTIPMHHKLVSNFFVMLQIKDTNTTFIGLRGDSLQVPGGKTMLDNSVDRSYFVTNTIQQYMGGVSYGGGDPFYPNFIIYAYVSKSVPSAVGETAVSDFSLGQSYPNPANTASQIEYSTPTSGKVTLTVSNALGQVVSTLVDGVQSAGSHLANFATGNLPSGLYFYTLHAGNLSQTNRLIISR